MRYDNPTLRLNNRRQAGFALIVGLLLLVVMSLIGVTMMNVTSLETRMAGGSRESNIAFQAAEAALRDAEARIETTTSIADDFDGTTAGQLSETDAEPNYSAAGSWGGGSIAYGPGDYPEVLAQPRFIVKHVGDVIDEATDRVDSISVGGGGIDVSTTPTVSIFRVTARGTSRDGAASAVLQSYYGRTY